MRILICSISLFFIVISCESRVGNDTEFNPQGSGESSETIFGKRKKNVFVFEHKIGLQKDCEIVLCAIVDSSSVLVKNDKAYIEWEESEERELVAMENGKICQRVSFYDGPKEVSTITNKDLDTLFNTSNVFIEGIVVHSSQIEQRSEIILHCIAGGIFYYSLYSEEGKLIDQCISNPNSTSVQEKSCIDQFENPDVRREFFFATHSK